MPKSFESLSLDLIVKVFSYLDPKSLLQIIASSKILKDIGQYVLFTQENSQALQKSWLNQLIMYEKSERISFLDTINPRLILNIIRNPQIPTTMRIEGLALIAASQRIDFKINEEDFDSLMKLMKFHTELNALRMLKYFKPLLSEMQKKTVLTKVLIIAVSRDSLVNRDLAMLAIEDYLPTCSNAIITSLFEILCPEIIKLSQHSALEEDGSKPFFGPLFIAEDSSGLLPVLRLLGSRFNQEQVGIILELLKNCYLMRTDREVKGAALDVLVAMKDCYSIEQKADVLSIVTHQLLDLNIHEDFYQSLIRLTQELTTEEITHIFEKLFINLQEGKLGVIRSIRVISSQLNQEQLALFLSTLVGSFTHKDDGLYWFIVDFFKNISHELDENHIELILDFTLSLLTHSDNWVQSDALCFLEQISSKMTVSQIKRTVAKCLESFEPLKKCIDKAFKTLSFFASHFSEVETQSILEHVKKLLIISRGREMLISNEGACELLAAIVPKLAIDQKENLFDFFTHHFSEVEPPFVKEKILGAISALNFEPQDKLISFCGKIIEEFSSPDNQFIRHETVKFLLSKNAYLSETQRELTLKKIIYSLNESIIKTTIPSLKVSERAWFIQEILLLLEDDKRAEKAFSTLNLFSSFELLPYKTKLVNTITTHIINKKLYLLCCTDFLASLMVNENNWEKEKANYSIVLSNHLGLKVFSDLLLSVQTSMVYSEKKTTPHLQLNFFGSSEPILGNSVHVVPAP